MAPSSEESYCSPLWRLAAKPEFSPQSWLAPCHMATTPSHSCGFSFRVFGSSIHNRQLILKYHLTTVGPFADPVTVVTESQHHNPRRSLTASARTFWNVSNGSSASRKYVGRPSTSKHSLLIEGGVGVAASGYSLGSKASRRRGAFTMRGGKLVVVVVVVVTTVVCVAGAKDIWPSASPGDGFGIGGEVTFARWRSRPGFFRDPGDGVAMPRSSWIENGNIPSTRLLLFCLPRVGCGWSWKAVRTRR